MGSVGVLHSVVLHRRSTAMKSVTVRSWSLSCFYSMNCFPQRIFQIVPCNQVSSTASSLKHVQAWSLFRRSDSGARTLEHDDVGYIRSTLGNQDKSRRRKCVVCETIHIFSHLLHKQALATDRTLLLLLRHIDIENPHRLQLTTQDSDTEPYTYRQYIREQKENTNTMANTAAAASVIPSLTERPIKNTICLFDVDGTLTPARRVSDT